MMTVMSNTRENAEHLPKNLALASAADASCGATMNIATGGGDTTCSPETLRKAVRMAREMDQNGDLEKIKGGRADARGVTLASGLAVPRTLLRGLIDNGECSAAQKKALRVRLEERLGATEAKNETGCLTVDFTDTASGAPGIAHIDLRECSPGHDLTAQLEVIYSRTPPEKKEEICRFLSLLVWAGREVYAELLMKNAGLVAEIRQAGKLAADPRALQVDLANTTFYLVPGWKKRVGIFVTLA